MPRLSVDIDLTYLPIKNRSISLNNIRSSLVRIKESLLKTIDGIKIFGPDERKDQYKLFCSLKGVLVKVEVNTIMRGSIESPVIRQLCQKAQKEFGHFIEMSVIQKGQLYGGKICAALDRQHPRDIFDIKYLFDNEGFTESVKRGFIFCLSGSDRPIHELMNPGLVDQQEVLKNQFPGMTEEIFTYNEFEEYRNKLIETVNNKLESRDREYLISLTEGKPDWSHYNFVDFPAIKWKLHNVKLLKQTNLKKHMKQLKELKKILLLDS